MNKKFIITQDQKTANKMIANGFHLVSNVSGTYAFVNEPSKLLVFGEDEKKLVCYTNILHI